MAKTGENEGADKTKAAGETDEEGKPQPKFVTGSTMRHVSVMTMTGSVGLVAIFLVDFADMFFLSLLGEVAIAAAIGYAGTILFFNTSISIGMAIAATALVSRALGAGDRERARRLAASSATVIFIAMIVIAAILFPLLPVALDLLGATGEARELALGYMQIIVPSMPLLGIGMVSGALLRATGDAKRSMYVTLTGGAVNAVFDPIFIFALDLGVDGAAMASVLSRFAIAFMGYWGVVRVHNLIARPSLRHIAEDIRPLAGIAVPAVLTNIATPVGNAYVTAAIAGHGDGAVAGWAIIGRLVPVAFGVIFALSGAVGPIFGQNLGARRFDRLQMAFRDSLIFCLGYVFVVWVLLALTQNWIVALFSVTGDAASLIRLFCSFIAVSFLFNGMLFVANATFNNLGFPTYSTALNWGKATLGTIPFVSLGALWGGAPGILIGQGVGAVLFGIIAAAVAWRTVKGMADNPPPPDAPRKPAVITRALWPFSSGKTFSAD
ncbi:MAG: MATE family efflux transporter [Pseudomonadota bacterium]